MYTYMYIGRPLIFIYDICMSSLLEVYKHFEYVVLFITEMHIKYATYI